MQVGVWAEGQHVGVQAGAAPQGHLFLIKRQADKLQRHTQQEGGRGEGSHGGAHKARSGEEQLRGGGQAPPAARGAPTPARGKQSSAAPRRTDTSSGELSAVSALWASSVCW